MAAKRRTKNKKATNPNRRGGAPKGNQNAVGNAGGRPGKYNPELHPLIAAAMAQAGCPDAYIAKALGIAMSTFHLWRSTYVEFSDALTQGAEVINQALRRTMLQKALGYSYETQKVTQKGLVVTVTEHLPPSDAMLKWLGKNRMPEEFSDEKKATISLDLEHAKSLQKMNERVLLRRATEAKVVTPPKLIEHEPA
jgi:hypothetical protein